MGRLFRSWRGIRWLAFLFALATDAYIFFELTTPFSPLSFMASGIGALLLFILFLEIALHLRGARRIRAALDETDENVYEVGRHVFDLLERIRKHPVAYNAIWFPVWIAIFTTAFIVWTMWHLFVLGESDPRLLGAFAYAGYLALLIAIPFVLEYVAEWASYRFVLVVDTESQDARLMLHHGVLEYHFETVSLERTVTISLSQSFWQSLVGIGDIELRETAGGEGELLKNVWRPRLLVKRIQSAIRRRRHAARAD